MPQDQGPSIRRTLLAVLAVLAVIAFLKWSASVTMPLGFALFLIATFWPVQRWLERRMPRGPATLFTLLAALVLLALFVGGLWFAASRVLDEWPRYEDQFREIRAELDRRMTQWGMSGGEDGGDAAPSSARQWLLRSVSVMGHVIAGVALILALMVLGMHEAHDWRRKLERIWGHSRDEGRGFDLLEEMTVDFQRYFVVRTGVGIIQGVVVWLVALAVGLEFGFTWAFLAFLLNYIPTIGSIVATFPPALWALVQYQSWSMAALVLVLMGLAQLICGNYIDPRLQGHYLKLSAVVVLFAVVFWGWVWGVGGAFISVPIMVAIVIICRRFERTRWIATLLADWREEGT